MPRVFISYTHDSTEHLYRILALSNGLRAKEYREAQPLQQRSLAIREKTLGADHPRVATSLNDLALLYQSQGKYDEAEPLYRRSLAILEKVLGPDHPNTKTVRANLNSLLQDDETNP